jgi:hypothetical protein
MVIEAVVEDYDLAQVGGKFIDEVVKAIVNLVGPCEVIEVRKWQRWVRGEDLLRRRVGLGYLAPDIASDGGPGVSRESSATVGIEVLDRAPKANATGLEEFGVRKGTTPLATDDSVNEALVVGHDWPETCRGRG